MAKIEIIKHKNCSEVRVVADEGLLLGSEVPQLQQALEEAKKQRDGKKSNIVVSLPDIRVIQYVYQRELHTAAKQARSGLPCRRGDVKLAEIPLGKIDILDACGLIDKEHPTDPQKRFALRFYKTAEEAAASYERHLPSFLTRS